MRHITTILLFLLSSFKLFGQTELSRINCDNFFYNINANTRMNIAFISNEIYESYQKDSIQKDKLLTIEDSELNKTFQKKFPNKITKNCINSKIYDNEEIRDYEYCNEKYNIRLIGKKYHFYIFKFSDGFEINSHLLFNTKNQTIYTINNYPQILENGKFIIDAGYEYGGENAINYYLFDENENLKYFEFRVPISYQLQDVKLIKSSLSPKIIANFIQYDLKEVPNNEYGKKTYEYDKEKFCKKIIMIN